MMQLHKSSGSARTAYEQIQYFRSKGFEVHIAAMTLDKEVIRELGAVPHKLLPYLKSTGFTRRRWYNWQVKRLRKKLNPKLTIGHGDIQEQDVLVLHNSVFLASELIHHRPLHQGNEMARTHGPLLTNQNFKVMIANSELMKTDTIERFQVPAEKIQVVYPGLDAVTFSPVNIEKKKQLRERFSLPDKVVVALVTSGNFKKRGLDIFIQAIEKLPPEIRNKASFRVLGKDEHGEYQRDYLTFDPGLTDIENYFRAIDVFVLPARIEEFGRVVLEAMGCGLPVITTNKVGAAELLDEESKRYVIPSEDSNSLKNAMVEMISRPELRSYLGELNVRLAQNASEERIREKFDRVFSTI